MTEQTEYQYDVFISYSHTDEEWVHGWLLPRLEAASLRVCVDFRDFDVGVPSLVNMERAVEDSRRTLLVLTPAWVKSEWTEFEALLTQTSDPAAGNAGCCRSCSSPINRHAASPCSPTPTLPRKRNGRPNCSGSWQRSGANCACGRLVRR